MLLYFSVSKNNLDTDCISLYLEAASPTIRFTDFSAFATWPFSYRKHADLAPNCAI